MPFNPSGKDPTYYVIMAALVSGTTFAVGQAWNQIITRCATSAVNAALCAHDDDACRRRDTLRGRIVGAIVLTIVLVALLRSKEFVDSGHYGGEIAHGRH